VIRVVSGILSLLIVALACPAGAQVYDFTAVPAPGETFTMADFRIYVPPGLPLARGVYFYVDPYQADSRYIVDDPAFRTLVAKNDFSLLGARLDRSHMDSGVGNAVLRALAAFADLSGHAEIAWTTIFFEGYSWGGQFSYHFTRWLPERVIGFVTQKGGYHETDPAGDAILVPGYLFIGENDLPYRIENLTGIFEEHRPLGARWILAVQPDAGHERITDRVLLDGYFQAVSGLRLPAEIPPQGPVTLQLIPADTGWLGNRDTFAIGAHDCYDAAVDSACWFATRSVGERWQAFVSGGAVTDTIPCHPAAAGPGPGLPAPVAFLAQNVPNPFNPATCIEYRLFAAGRVRLTIHDAAGRRITSLVDAFQEADRHSVRWQGSDARGVPVGSGTYFCRLQAGWTTQVRKMTLLR